MTTPFNAVFVGTNNGFLATFEEEPEFDAHFSHTIVIEKETTDQYHGPYIVTPSRETQILETKNLLLNKNVTVNPIPSNYGLITWDGAKLTVS